MKTTILFICALCLSLCASSQSDSTHSKPFQFTFFYPVGTAGVNSANNGYITSVNLLAGITGSANGFEIGSIANINKEYNHGIQLAGICNITGSYSSGAELAGICNINGGSATGAQIGGIGNIAGGSAHGAQLGGIFNIVGGTFKGAAFSGITNMSGGRMDGITVAGIMNSSADSVKGFQAAGIVNISGDADACQIAGITNVAAGGSKVQVGGIGNMAMEVEGIQIGGIFNVAGTVKGVQLAGIINICDSIDGVPIALVSIVRKNGYRRFEIWGSEAFYMNISYKIGIRQLYSILSLGYKTGDRHNNAGLGVGLGTTMQLAGKNSLDLEGHMYHINRFLWMNEENYLYTLKLNYARNFNERLALFIGPTLNMLSTEINSDAHDISPGYGVEHERSNDWQYWVGFNAGVRF
jgi:hypothetical protein